MRKLLLAGIAVSGAAVYLPSSALAQSAVFPETTRAGKLNGAAPNSVSVSIGGTMFTAIEFQSGTTDKSVADGGTGRITSPNFVNYIRLYPNFDYTNPAGVHFGVSAEIRSNGSAQGENRSTNQLWWHSAFAYVSSDKFGKFESGTPNDAADALGVGTGDNYGTGGFYGEYGWPGAPNFIAADAYDGDVPHQKIAYISPSFGGFTLGLSYQPNSIGLSNSGNNTTEGDFGLSHNRYSAALQFSHGFGPVAAKANIAYTGAGTGSTAGTGNVVGFHDVSIFNAGTSITLAGFELEGSVNTGKFAYKSPSGSEPVMGPIPNGEKSTTAYIVGVGYTIGAFSVGAQYYNVTFDAAQNGGTLGGNGQVSGEALGAAYAVGPGVNLNLDLATNWVKTPGAQRVNGSLAAVGCYFAW
jgi:outer membrane protein OmpU